MLLRSWMMVIEFLSHLHHFVPELAARGEILEDAHIGTRRLTNGFDHVALLAHQGPNKGGCDKQTARDAVAAVAVALCCDSIAVFGADGGDNVMEAKQGHLGRAQSIHRAVRQ